MISDVGCVANNILLLQFQSPIAKEPSQSQCPQCDIPTHATRGSEAMKPQAFTGCNRNRNHWHLWSYWSNQAALCLYSRRRTSAASIKCKLWWKVWYRLVVKNMWHLQISALILKKNTESAQTSYYCLMLPWQIYTIETRESSFIKQKIWDLEHGQVRARTSGYINSFL